MTKKVKKLNYLMMVIDSAWIFRICLCITVVLILCADFFGSVRVADARSDDGGVLNSYSLERSRKGDKGALKLLADNYKHIMYVIISLKLLPLLKNEFF